MKFQEGLSPHPGRRQHFADELVPLVGYATSKSFPNDAGTKMKKRQKAFWSGIFVIAIIALVTIVLLKLSNSSSAPESIKYKDSPKKLSFEVSNEYTRVQGSYGAEYPWISESNMKVFEPWREHETAVVGEALNDCSNETYIYGIVGDLATNWQCNFTWSVERDNEVHMILHGQVGHITLTSTGTYTVRVKQFLAPVGSAQSHAIVYLQEVAEMVTCKYVRREARNLFRDDQHHLIQAMRELYDIDIHTGQNIYGDDYKDMVYFVKRYADLANDYTCDHLNEGLGFLTNHIAFTAEFEKSLQIINPQVALAYWDYTIDATRAAEVDEINAARMWRQSELFTSDWFGSSSPENNAHTMDKGLFAFLRVAIDDDDSVQYTNAYGYIRSPWNMNNSPFIARYNTTFEFTTSKFPTCGDFLKTLNYESWYDFGMNVAHRAHMPMQRMIGGAWHAGFNFKNAEAILGHDKAGLLTTFSVSSYAQFWRSGIMDCPSYCSSDTKPEDCHCGCAGLNLTSEHEFALLEKANIFELMVRHDVDEELIRRVYTTDGVVSYEWVGMEGTLNSDVPTHFLYEMICNVGMTGDILGGGSPVDPVFWLSYPNIERMWQLKRLSVECAYTYEWPNNTSIYGTCSGHDEHDVVPFSALEDWDGESALGLQEYTNKELYDLFDPHYGNVDYIYDNFEWLHCLDEGVDLYNFCSSSASDVIASEIVDIAEAAEIIDIEEESYSHHSSRSMSSRRSRSSKQRSSHRRTSHSRSSRRSSEHTGRRSKQSESSRNSRSARKSR